MDALIYFPAYLCPWKHVQTVDLIRGLPGTLKNEQANSLISRVSLESEIQSIKDKKHSTEIFFLVFDQKGKELWSEKRLRKKAMPQK